MKRSERLFVWTLNATAGLASWALEAVARNVQVGLNLMVIVCLGAVLYVVLVLVGLSQLVAIAICLLVMFPLFMLVESADSFVWLILPTRYYGNFLVSLIRLRCVVRANSILIIATLIVWLLELVAALLRPFSRSSTVRLLALSSDLQSLGRSFRALELAQLRSP